MLLDLYHLNMYWLNVQQAHNNKHFLYKQLNLVANAATNTLNNVKNTSLSSGNMIWIQLFLPGLKQEMSCLTY